MKVLFDFFQTLLREGEGAGGGDGGAAGGDAPALVKAAAGDGGDDGNAGDGGKAGDDAGKATDTTGAGDDGKAAASGDESDGDKAPAPYFPEGLPEAWKGETDQETLDKIAEAQKALPKPPETAEAYDFTELPEDFKKSFGDLKDDPVVPLWKAVAHELGLPNDVARDVIPKLYDKMSEAGLIDDPVNVENELKELMPEAGDAEQKKAAATERINSAIGTVKALQTRGELSEGEATAVVQVMATANGVKAVEKLMKLAKVEGQKPGGDSVPDKKDPHAIMYPTMSAAS